MMPHRQVTGMVRWRESVLFMKEKGVAELVAHELAANACWIQVRTDRGVESALTFYADPVDAPVARLPVEEQARLLATAAGAAVFHGKGAESNE